jgi:hypothetical protein
VEHKYYYQGTIVSSFSQKKPVEHYGDEMHHEGHLETARRMLEKGKFSLDDVAECTGLSLEEVCKLWEELQPI